MTDQPGGEPEQRLPVPRPPVTPAPAERFTAPPSAHALALTPERAAVIVRQSASARSVGLLAVLVVSLFVAIYYFYDLGIPGISGTARLAAEASAQQVTAVERGYNIFEANCARCHGANGEGGIGPVLHDQTKLFQHLNATYIAAVLREGGRLVCGNAKSLMPVWSNEGNPPGPLNYIEIQDLIAFIRAPQTQTFLVRDPTTNEPVKHATGKDETFNGWLDPKAFVRPADGFWGSASQNILGPGVITINAGLTRSFKVTEGQAIQFRAEAFNLPNHMNPNDPILLLNNQNFGKIQSAREPRIIQFALKYTF